MLYESVASLDPCPGTLVVKPSSREVVPGNLKFLSLKKNGRLTSKSDKTDSDGCTLMAD